MPKHPASIRDIALLCDDNIPIGTIQKTIKSAAGDLLESIKLFDIYKGSQIEKGKKSVAFTIALRSKDSTLTDDQTNKTINKIIDKLSKIGVSLRS